MNKTSISLISRLVNRYDTGGAKHGWTLTVPNKDTPFLSLQKLNEGNAAHKLADAFPDIFSADQKQWRLVVLRLLDETKARALIQGKG